MAYGSKSDIDILVSCIRNSVIVTNEETGKCEVIPPPLTNNTCDIARLVEMYVIFQYLHHVVSYHIMTCCIISSSTSSWS